MYNFNFEKEEKLIEIFENIHIKIIILRLPKHK